MNSYLTKSGIELPILNLKGKAYLQVAYRILWFRSEKPEWTIETEIVSTSEKQTIAKARILNESGRLIADGYKQETAQHFPDHLEKACTGAIGRALALCGYGTQFTEDLFEDDRIVDSPVVPVVPSIQPKVNVFTKNTFMDVILASKEMNWDVEKHLRVYMKERFGKEVSKDLTPDEVKEFLHTVKHNSFDHAMKLLIK